MRDMAHSICLIKLSSNDEKKKFRFLFLTTLNTFITSAPFLVKVCDIVNVLRISNNKK